MTRAPTHLRDAAFHLRNSTRSIEAAIEATPNRPATRHLLLQCATLTSRLARQCLELSQKLARR